MNKKKEKLEDLDKVAHEIFELGKGFIKKELGCPLTIHFVKEVKGKQEKIAMEFPCSNLEEKEKSLFLLGKVVEEIGLKKYYLMMNTFIGSTKGKESSIRPSQREKKREALVLSKFSEDGDNLMIIQEYKKVRNKYVFEKEQIISDKGVSIWNVFKKIPKKYPRYKE